MPEPVREMLCRDRKAAAAGAARSQRLRDGAPARRHACACARRIRSPPYPSKLTEPLEHWAGKAPDRMFLAQRDAQGGWRTLTYARGARAGARRSPAALLQRDLSPERPIAILSGNDIEQALLGLAAAYVGIPYAPISPAYSLMSSDFGKLRHIIGLLTPGLVFAADGNAVRARDRGRGAGRRRSWWSRAIRRRTGRRRCSRSSSRRPQPLPRSTPPTPRSVPTPSRNSCSPRARPASPRA